jgi:UDP-N-acetylmuramoyl-L-alanyl-D-glutamate--2,6-diaminopimelate ligase
VTGIEFDSRCVQQGSLFVALVGGNTDGHRYIPDAIRRGAAAVVGMQNLEGLAVPYFQINDSRLALATLAAAWYGFPARRMTVIGVTGTDGKTTTSNIIYQILRTAGLRSGMISTVNAVIGNRILDTGFHVTTPEATDVQRYLAEMVDAGLDYVVLEATSHGLDQQRVAACDFDIGVVTNITHEHLDYHGDYVSYRAAKARLFTGLSDSPAKPFRPARVAVLNVDDASYPYLSEMTRVRQVSYGLNSGADVQASNILYTASGMRFDVSVQDSTGNNFNLPIETPMVGEFNVSNCLAAISVGIGALNLSPDAVRQGIAALPAVPGRMEWIDLNLEHAGTQDFTTIVDFAHTPNALRRALEAVRRLTTGRIIVVFGCAGLRDRAKRRMMAEEAARLADISVLTAEDPRTESLTAILDEMAAGARAQGGIEGRTFWRIADRREALRFAVNLACTGDLVIACGKGHEQSMCFGDVEYAWDDRVAMRAALAELFGAPGPEMPFLPSSNS